MLCVIPGVNLKVFARVIHALSKIGDEIYFEADANGLSVRTVNSSRSAFATFFFKPSFFIKYQHKSLHNSHSNDENDDHELENDDEEENKNQRHKENDKEEILKCKVYTKSCLTVFKGGSNMDKLVDRCRLSLDSDADRFVFTLFCRYGLVKTFKLTYSECEKLKAIFNTQTSLNSLRSPSKLLIDVVGNFQTGVDEMKVSMSAHSISFRNHLDHKQEVSGGCVKTEVVLHSSEFDEYSFSEDTISVFCLKEFRAFLFFCELSNMDLSMYADQAGRPIVFALETDPSFECHLVLATVASEHLSTTQTPLKSKEAPKKKVKRRKKKSAEEEEEDNNHVDVSNVVDDNNVSGDGVANGAFESNFEKADEEDGGDEVEGEHGGGDVEMGGSGEEEEDNDVVEASPPREPPNKKLKSIFCALSQSPELTPSKESKKVVLVEDSESE